MKVISFRDVQAFHDCVLPRLLLHECENCTMIGVLGRLTQGKSPVKTGAPTIPLLLAVLEDNRVFSVAIQTPPHALMISPSQSDALCALVEYLNQVQWPGDQMVATAPTIHRSAEAFGRLTNRKWTRQRGLRVMRAETVTDPPRVAGALRVTTENDMPLVTEWAGAFARDIGEDTGDPGATARIVISEQRAHLWVDDDGSDTPLAMCSWAGPTPNGVRVNFVYTPPPLRGRGYASNATAELTRKLLASGRKFCFLFTDADNPTSNSIYRKIGYRHVADFEHVRFSS